MIPLLCSYKNQIRVEALNTLKIMDPDRFNKADHKNIFSLITKNERKIIINYLNRFIHKKGDFSDSEYKARLLHLLDCLDQINSQSTIPTLLHLIQMNKSIIREKAVKIFFKLGYPKYLNEIFQFLISSNLGVYNITIEYLREIPLSEYIIPLIQFYKANADRFIVHNVYLRFSQL